MPKTIAAIMVTSRCNANCRFCISSKDNIEKTADAIKDLIDHLGSEIKRVAFTGGDVLLRDDIFDLAAYAKSKGYETKIQTNGILLPKISDEKLKNIDIFNLPLDGDERCIHDEMRFSGSYGLIISNFERLNRMKKRISVTTVFTKKNKRCMKRMQEILNRYGVESWRIFRFHAAGRGLGHKDEFEVSDDEFLEGAEDLKLSDGKVYVVGDYFKNESYEMH